MAFDEDFLSPGRDPYTHCIQLQPYQQEPGLKEGEMKTYKSQILHKKIHAQERPFPDGGKLSGGV
jgi:hypothetical protein